MAAMAHEAEVWKYTRLENDSDQIRILALLPGKGDETICCSQVIVYLHEAIEYEALSYTWGDSKTTDMILLEDKPCPVTSNLHSALQHLRLKESPRHVWIDALCINQRNDKEKSAQVQIMGDIYRQASRVLAWLEKAADDSDLAMDFLNERIAMSDRFLRSSNSSPSSLLVKSSEKDTQSLVRPRKVVVKSDGYTTIGGDGNDSDDEPSLDIHVSISDTDSGSSIDNPIGRFNFEQMNNAKQLYYQDDTVLLPLNERCKQCKSHESPCWWNGKDQCVQCVANSSVADEPCSLFSMNARYSELLETGLAEKPRPDFYSYLAGFDGLAISGYADNTKQTQLPQITEKVWVALFRLAQRPWWRRTWILQEVSINPSEPVIMCGDKITTWKAIEDFPGRAMAEGILPTSAGARWLHFAQCTSTFVETRERIQKTPTIGLSELLDISHRLESSDPRDKIFALLNLADPSDRLRCKADYSLSVTEVYAQTALHIIRTTKKLTIFGSITGRSETLPSWVPDWSRDRKGGSISPLCQYSASKNLAAQTLHSPVLTTLTIRGFPVSHVTHVSKPISVQEIWPSFHLPTFSGMLDSLEELVISAMDSAYQSRVKSDRQSERRWWRFFRLFPDPRVSDTFWRTLVCDSHQCRGGTERRSPAPVQWAEIFEVLRNEGNWGRKQDASYQYRCELAQRWRGLVAEIPHLETPSPLQIPSEGLEELAKPLLMQLAMSLQQRRFFIMDSGHMGLATSEVREGDMVHILFGGDVPHLLRKKDDGNLMRLVGEAYVHEFMHGESLGTASHEAITMRSTTFNIA